MSAAANTFEALREGLEECARIAEAIDRDDDPRVPLRLRGKKLVDIVDTARATLNTNVTDPARLALRESYRTLREHMSAVWDEDEWPETVFWDAYVAACDYLLAVGGEAELEAALRVADEKGGGE